MGSRKRPPAGRWREGDLLDTKQVAEWLGVQRNLLEQWRHRGQGPAFIKTGGKLVRYRREDVEAWIEVQLRTTSRKLPVPEDGVQLGLFDREEGGSCE